MPAAFRCMAHCMLHNSHLLHAPGACSQHTYAACDPEAAGPEITKSHRVAPTGVVQRAAVALGGSAGRLVRSSRHPAVRKRGIAVAMSCTDGGTGQDAETAQPDMHQASIQGTMHIRAAWGGLQLPTEHKQSQLAGPAHYTVQRCFNNSKGAHRCHNRTGLHMQTCRRQTLD